LFIWLQEYYSAGSTYAVLVFVHSVIAVNGLVFQASIFVNDASGNLFQ